MAAVCDGTVAPSSMVIWSLWWPKCGTTRNRHLGSLLEPHAAARTSDLAAGRNCDQLPAGVAPARCEVFPLRSRLPSKNWIPSLNSGRLRSWESFSRRATRSRSRPLWRCLLHLPLPQPVGSRPWQALPGLACDHNDLASVMSFVRHEIGQHVSDIERKVSPNIPT
jgi:hypothetical protein